LGDGSVVVVSNPIAGRGAAGRVAAEACAALERAGMAAVRVESGLGGRAAMENAIRAVPGARAIVVCGGDGTVQAVAGVAHETGVPVYQVPMGTENLFAREFGMTRRLDRMVEAVRELRVVRVDLARCNGAWFLLMCSVGPDAAVVRRLAKARRGAITHWSYARHVAAEIVRPTVQRITVRVDGREVVGGRAGMAVVANSRQYALRLDPAYRASMRDGELDVVFLPARGRVGLVKWLMLSRMRAQSWGGRGLVRERGRCVEIENCGGGLAFQMDGEAGREAEAVLRIEVVPGALGVVEGKAQS
jgi:diacylglycerol kinase family enzyme